MAGCATRHLAAMLVSATLLAGCGVNASTDGQSVGATTANTTKTSTSKPRPAKTTTTTQPILVPGTKRSLVASPAVVAIGQTLTVSGAGCPFGGRVQELSPAGFSVNVKPIADGTWSVTATVPDNSGIGTLPVTAVCFGPKLSAAEPYTPVEVQVTTYRHLEVQPGTTVHPGTTLTITAVGGCPGPNAPAETFSDPEVYINFTKDNRADAGVQQQVLQRGSSTPTGSLFVPAQLAPGAYLLSAECDDNEDRKVDGYYTPVPITVVATGVALPQPSEVPAAREIPVTR